MWSSSPQTLLTRVSKNIFLVTITLFMMFSAVTFFIIYGFEDAAFEESLRQTGLSLEEGGKLPKGYLRVDDLSEFNLSPIEHLKFLDYDFEGPFLEFEHQGTHYHSMRYKNGYLILDTSGKGLVRRAMGDITLLLVFMLIPVVLFSFYISRKISAYAIKPFTDISKVLMSEELNLESAKALLQQVKEEDVKQLALQMTTALEQKSLMLQNQIVFNQGMAHELKTPLQVMTHSIELLQHIEPSVTDKSAFKRLDKSVIRMKRISQGLLWLTDENAEKHATKVSRALQTILTENQPLLSAQQILVDVNKEAELSFPIPEIVMELVIFNLLNNVVHHCQVADSQKTWRIDIKQNQISFANPVADNIAAKRVEKHFGLGLGLVEKLLSKFNLKLQLNQSEGWFTVIIINEFNV